MSTVDAVYRTLLYSSGVGVYDRVNWKPQTVVKTRTTLAFGYPKEAVVLKNRLLYGRICIYTKCQPT